jgi:hypothetical protein
VKDLSGDIQPMILSGTTPVNTCSEASIAT